MRLAEVGSQAGGILEVEVRAVDVAAGKLLRPEPVVGLPRIEVVLKRVFPHVILVHPVHRVAERQERERGKEEGAGGEERRLRFLLRLPEKPDHAGAQKRDDADHRQVDEVVGHPGDPHIGDGHEAEHRRDHEQEEAKRKERVAAPVGQRYGVAVLPHPPGATDDQGPGKKHPRLGRIDLPPRIDRQQVYRPHDRRQVVEDGHSRDRRPGEKPAHGEQVADDDLFLADRPAPLIRHRHEAEHDRDDEQWRGDDQVAHRHRATLPPGVEQRDDGEGHDRRLGEHREQEEDDRDAIEPLALGRVGLVVLAHPADRRDQEERQRESVFGFRHPGHALDAHRMDGKHESREPGAGNPHLREERPEEQRACDMEQDRGDVVAGGTQAEKGPLRPERRVGERKVIGAVGIEPEFCERLQAVRRNARVGGDPVLHGEVLREELVVVPEPVAVVGGRVDPQAREHDHGSPQEKGVPAIHAVGSRRFPDGGTGDEVAVLFNVALTSQGFFDRSHNWQ